MDLAQDVGLLFILALSDGKVLDLYLFQPSSYDISIRDIGGRNRDWEHQTESFDPAQPVLIHACIEMVLMLVCDIHP